jgi:hypothetical protein
MHEGLRLALACGSLVAASVALVAGAQSDAAAPVPAHLETWAYDRSHGEGQHAPATLVRQWVTYAESTQGEAKAFLDCRPAGHPCKAIGYINPSREYGSARCPRCSIRDPDSRRHPESWWLHLPGSDPADPRSRIVVHCYGEPDCTGSVANLSQADDLRETFAEAARRFYDRHDGLMVDDQAPSLRAMLYDFVCGQTASCPTQSAEIATDDQQQLGVRSMAAAFTHRDGSTFTQIENGITDNPYVPPSVGRLDYPGVVGLVAEGQPISGGGFAAWKYPSLLDELAYVNTRPGPAKFVVLLSTYDGSDRAVLDRSRRVHIATVLLGYARGHTVSWEDVASGDPSKPLEIWPEEGLYPTGAVRSMTRPGDPGGRCFADGFVPDPDHNWYCTTGGHNDLEPDSANHPGVFVREFRACYDAGQPIGRCAAVVNTSESAQEVSALLSNGSYRYEIGFTYPHGSGVVGRGGKLDLTEPWDGTVAASDAVILRGS